MIRYFLLGLCLCMGMTSVQAQYEPAASVAFDDYFYDKAMRLDFYHCGNRTEETYYFDELREEPYYAGSLVALNDTFDYGNQRFCLYDKQTGQLIFSHNYCTLFNEWQTTDEARTTRKGMPEGVVFPYPKNDVVAKIYSRNKQGGWDLKFTHEIDADDYFVRGFRPMYETVDVQVAGDPHHCVDIVLLSEGYGKDDKEMFEDDCRYFTEELMRYEPFKSNKKRLNVRGVWSPSTDSGVSLMNRKDWKNTVLKANYYTFRSERYQMTEDFQSVRDAAAHVPYDYIYILTNSDKYGGGGIYHFYGIGAAHHPSESGRVHVHEFGHLFIGLGDEYVEVGNTVSDLYSPTVEPWEANLTTLVDFDKKAWSRMIKKNTPIPTPENKHKKYPIGLYEGGGYLGKGIYRPTPNCLMRTLDYDFCPVCQRAINDYFNFICR